MGYNYLSHNYDVLICAVMAICIFVYLSRDIW